MKRYLWYGYSASNARFSSTTFTAGSPMKPKARPAWYLSTSDSYLIDANASCLRDPLLL